MDFSEIGLPWEWVQRPTCLWEIRTLIGGTGLGVPPLCDTRPPARNPPSPSMSPPKTSLYVMVPDRPPLHQQHHPTRNPPPPQQSYPTPTPSNSTTQMGYPPHRKLHCSILHQNALGSHIYTTLVIFLYHLILSYRYVEKVSGLFWFATNSSHKRRKNELRQVSMGIII